MPKKRNTCIRQRFINRSTQYHTVVPRPTDVILGRGKGVATWRGNVVFRTIVWEYREAYSQAGRFSKANIAEKVVQAISKLDPPGRFVELVQEDMYVLIDHDRAVEKACQALREKNNCCPPKIDMTSTN
jgi:hypothetical protein